MTDPITLFAELIGYGVLIFFAVALGRFLILAPTYLKRIAEALENQSVPNTFLRRIAEALEKK